MSSGFLSRLFGRSSGDSPVVSPPVSAPVVENPRAKPKTILIAWEMGGGMGHINRLTPLALRLREQGHRLVFAFRNRPTGDSFARQFPGCVVVQAPGWRRPADPPGTKKWVASNYPDMLHRCGYESPEILGRLVRLWHQLFAQVEPAMILCDQSPTVVLAAMGRIPVVHIGCGLAIPPPGLASHFYYPAASSGAAEREVRVLQTIQAVQRTTSGPIPETVSQVLDSARAIACCLPELDPYRSVRPEPASGPVEILPQPQPIDPTSKFLFGYLTGEDERVPALLRSLAKAKITAGIYLRQPTPACLDAVNEGGTVELYTTPQPMEITLRRSAAILHHGGLATAEAALAMGRPQFLFPRHLEQSLTANAIEALGCGMNLKKQKSDAGEIMGRAIHRKQLNAEAVTAATRIGGQNRTATTDSTIERCIMAIKVGTQSVLSKVNP